MARRGKRFILYELLQNAWDENSRYVEVLLSAEKTGTSKTTVRVIDDNPEGFKELAHAYTLFAPSPKKKDATKRGRFNLGEKLVIAACRNALIITTKGSIEFRADGTRSISKKECRKFGSEFQGVFTTTHGERDDLEVSIKLVIPPLEVRTSFNGRDLPRRDLQAELEDFLQTEVEGDEGHLMRVRRKTKIQVYEPLTGETAMLYEMGIPVMETGDRWHVNIMQKVPLNMERDNVPSAFLADVRVLVANAMREQLTTADANMSWARDALADIRCTDDTARTLVKLRFGEKAVVYDPSDTEANALATTKGYTVVTGSQLSGSEWNVVKRAGALLPAGRVTPSPKPFSSDGRPLKLLNKATWNDAMCKFEKYACRIAKEVLGATITVTIASDSGWGFAACYGRNELTVNLARLGRGWFERLASADMNELLIHEFAHHYEGNHLSERYHESLCRIGARLAALALAEPKLFK